MLFSCRKYVILERSSWKLPSALSKNCVSLFIYFCINICFCIKQANKICTLLGLTAEYPAILKLHLWKGWIRGYAVESTTPPQVNSKRYWKVDTPIRGYADTQWKTWIPGYVDTRTSHMGTGYQLRVTYFKMLCSICMDGYVDMRIRSGKYFTYCFSD